MVTETEWLEAIDSWPMLRFLENQNPSRRKIHLFWHRIIVVQCARQQIRGRDPVGQRMVHLADHRDAVIGHTLRKEDVP